MMGSNGKLGFILVSLMMLGGTPGRGATESSVLVVPARRTLVQLAFDLRRLRNQIELVSYREARDGQFVFYRWDARRRGWIEMDEAAVSVGPAACTLAIGQDRDVTERLTSARRWPLPVHAMPSLKLTDLVNRAAAVYNLQPDEWRWIAARYRLSLKDLNAERRRYGRYGRPGSQQLPPTVIVPDPPDRVDSADPAPRRIEPPAAQQDARAQQPEVERIAIPMEEVMTESELPMEAAEEDKGRPSASPSAERDVDAETEEAPSEPDVRPEDK